jgi:hypothetical protein
VKKRSSGRLVAGPPGLPQTKRKRHEMLISQRKLNETAEHYELKQVAKYILWSRGYTIIGTEVSGFYDAHLRNDGFPEGCAHKNTIDTVGIRAQGWEAGSVRSIGIYGIEAKASLSDYKNGFCTVCPYTSIIAPLGVIPADIIPNKIGLIEVDIANYSINFRSNGEMESEGIYYTIPAKQRMAPRFQSKEHRKLWAFNQFKRIAYRCSHENLFITPQIKLD